MDHMYAPWGKGQGCPQSFSQSSQEVVFGNCHFSMKVLTAGFLLVQHFFFRRVSEIAWAALLSTDRWFQSIISVPSAPDSTVQYLFQCLAVLRVSWLKLNLDMLIGWRNQSEDIILTISASLIKVSVSHFSLEYLVRFLITVGWSHFSRNQTVFFHLCLARRLRFIDLFWGAGEGKICILLPWFMPLSLQN